MGRFIRRVFILLVLFTLIFLVYRYINPTGASIFVERLKSIPTQISDFIGSDKEKELNIVDTTLLITGDTVDLVEDQENVSDMKENTGEDELTWLEELNLEIESILGSDADKTGKMLDGELTGEILEVDVGYDIEIGSDNDEILAIEDQEVVVDDQEVLDQNIVKQMPVNQENEDEVNIDNSTPKVLTDNDYKQMEDVFGKLVE